MLALMAAMISPGSLSHLKVVVVDRDGGASARRIVRAVEASPHLELARVTGNIVEALSAVRREDAFAILVIPHGLEDVSPKSAPIEIFYEGQFLAAGNLAATYTELAVQSALVSGAPQHLGISGAQALRLARPGVKISLLGNPTLSLEWYLGLLLGPATLHLLIAVSVIGSIGTALCEGYLQSESRGALTLPCSFAARLSPHIAAGTLWGIVWMLWLTLARGYRFEGSLIAAVIGLFLLFCATAAIGLLLIIAIRNVATALSGAVIIAGSALAYSGASLPIAGAPVIARFWSAVLPLTHYLRLQMAVVAGAGAAPIVRELLLLLLYPILAGGVTIALIWYRQGSER
jgi:ABC-2 type transport system permease protein